MCGGELGILMLNGTSDALGVQDRPGTYNLENVQHMSMRWLIIFWVRTATTQWYDGGKINKNRWKLKVNLYYTNINIHGRYPKLHDSPNKPWASSPWKCGDAGYGSTFLEKCAPFSTTCTSPFLGHKWQGYALEKVQHWLNTSELVTWWLHVQHHLSHHHCPSIAHPCAPHPLG